MEAGQYEQAAQAYLVSVAADKTNAEALAGLKSAGQRSIDEKAIRVIRAQEAEDVKTAVTTYMEIKDFVNKTSAVGVTLLISDMATTSFNEAKPIYLEQIYGEAQQKIEAAQFADALTLLIEVNTIEPGYSEVDELLVIAKCEPIYRAAQLSFNAGKYRTAYMAYKSLVSDEGSYKDASDLMAQAFGKAQMTIKVDDFVAGRGNSASASTLKNELISSINGMNNEFIKVVDSKNIDRLVAEQQNAIANGAEIEIGQILAPKAILSGNISEFSKTSGNLVKNEQRGYLKKVVKEKKADGSIVDVTLYDKITYVEYKVKNAANVCLNYQLASIETSQVLIADKACVEKVDDLVYVEFSGDSKNLIPGYWEYPNKESAKDNMSTDKKEIEKLRAACKAKRAVKSADVLLEEAIAGVVTNVAQKINKYNPEK